MTSRFVLVCVTRCRVSWASAERGNVLSVDGVSSKMHEVILFIAFTQPSDDEIKEFIEIESGLE